MHKLSLPAFQATLLVSRSAEGARFFTLPPVSRASFSVRSGCAAYAYCVTAIMYSLPSAAHTTSHLRQLLTWEATTTT